ncbi:MAG: competence/damage-inducible protein A [Chitinophagales bacterium]|nr:competence/damage-inducible protein A [Chitinophagales bacterium]MDW8418384.1 competence/damage-inducible protein A [Chitinophagales bacterium]
MKAAVITIGDEILLGQVVDTNSAWLGQRLSELGIQLQEIMSCSDNEEHIISAMDRARSLADFIFMTGGLGPTKDDITKNTLVKYFDTTLELNEEVWEKIKSYFAKRGREVLEINRSQAMIPKDCIMLPNERGTAQGMWFEKHGKVFVSMPGVPHEMKHIMEERVIPMLRKRYTLPPLVHRVVMTAGVGESMIAAKLSEFEKSLPGHFKLAYLPDLGIVRLRLTAKGHNPDLPTQADHYAAQMAALLGNWVYAMQDEKLEVSIGKLLCQHSATLSCAESCTGGYIAHLLTSVPGSSAYFEGSMVTYSYAQKEALLGVGRETLQTYGAVSEECVREMLTGLLQRTNTTYGIAVSGIAGPTGDTPDKPVGTVWIAVGDIQRQIARRYQFFRGRAENIRVFAYTALNMLRLFIQGDLHQH